MGEFFRIGWIIICSGLVGYVIGLAHSAFISEKGIPSYTPPPPKRTQTGHLPNIKNTYTENGWLCFELLNGDRIRLNFNDPENLKRVIKNWDDK